MPVFGGRTIKVARTDQFAPAGGGSLARNGSIAGQFGQAVNMIFKSRNKLESIISVKDTSPFVKIKELSLLPLQSATFSFTRFGEGPMDWNFEISTASNAFIVSYQIESTWTEGMPVNPCY